MLSCRVVARLPDKLKQGFPEPSKQSKDRFRVVSYAVLVVRQQLSGRVKLHEPRKGVLVRTRLATSDGAEPDDPTFVEPRGSAFR